MNEAFYVKAKYKKNKDLFTAGYIKMTRIEDYLFKYNIQFSDMKIDDENVEFINNLKNETITLKLYIQPIEKHYDTNDRGLYSILRVEINSNNLFQPNDNSWLIQGNISLLKNTTSSFSQQLIDDIYHFEQPISTELWFSDDYTMKKKCDLMSLVSILYSHPVKHKYVPKNEYIFDWKLIKSEIDICFLLIMEFFDGEAYLSMDLWSSFDILYNTKDMDRSFFYGKKFIFKNVSSIYENNVVELFNEMESHISVGLRGDLKKNL